MKILIEGEVGACRIKSDGDYEQTVEFLILLVEQLLPEPGDTVPVVLTNRPAGPGDAVN